MTVEALLNLVFEAIYMVFNCLKVEHLVLFRCEKILDFATVALSFVCGEYCLIMD
jgi:hypothetical protein